MPSDPEIDLAKTLSDLKEELRDGFASLKRELSEEHESAIKRLKSTTSSAPKLRRKTKCEHSDEYFSYLDNWYKPGFKVNNCADTTTDADSSILLKNSTEHVNDLGLYYTKAESLSDDRKLELLKNSWKPPRAYNSPKTQFCGKNREGKMLSISEQLSDIHRNTVELNRQKLRSIIKTVVLCGKQNMALRGHRDDPSHLDESSGNPGNFQALLNFRVEAGDKVLANHFANGPINATYRSKTIQIEIIEVLGTYIQDKIGAFSLLADEASDSSNKEQLLLVLRFVDKERNIREEFVGFYECEDGVTIATHTKGRSRTWLVYGFLQGTVF
ncbi:52 kDa repressor of the inhibitor of the protein kinase [Stylophora pistillata]|uniref:52 kDa repressor of the inhibitor of the protein kinase n=1 Tax=Stylophora pistillata TaxID=50429 RepID=A0A2B4RNI9_STYPI|nr:52 kDa repressor of the inhibitor of the protein kinase [Stylophora pistillata]